jgi:hypothetical protein
VVNPALIVQELNRAGVDYVVIGGVAATLYGCPEQTYDLDILYAATPENRAKLLHALRVIEAQWDRPLSDEILQRQPVFALNTKHGDLDIFTAIPGLDDYASAAAAADVLHLEGIPVKVLDLPTLILTKEAAADPNPRKQSALAFLKAIQPRNSRS